jgi:hypothetical protein
VASTYGSFEVKSVDRVTGAVTFYPGATVQVRDITDAVAPVRLMPDLTADGDGHVASGSLAIAADSLVRFSWQDDPSGINGFAEGTTY